MIRIAFTTEYKLISECIDQANQWVLNSSFMSKVMAPVTLLLNCKHTWILYKIINNSWFMFTFKNMINLLEFYLFICDQNTIEYKQK